MASILCYQETVDELRQKLLYTNLELEQLKAEKKDEMRKNKGYVKQLIQILKIVCEERDEAKNQLQKLLNKLVLKSTKANSSSITDQSNSLSSEIDSFFNSISSPDECSNNNIDHDHNIQFADNNCVTQLAPKVDKASLVIDNLVKGKLLPQQGKLLQAVVEAGPILQTLLVSGQLPQWQNPPKFTQFNIPQVCVSESMSNNQKFDASYFEDSRSSSLHISQPQMLSTSMLNFANLENQSLMSAGEDLNSFVLRKRQRLLQ